METLPLDLSESINSIATLKFLGLTQKVAGGIFERWVARPNPEQNPDGLLQ
jgi:hypothetical protein